MGDEVALALKAMKGGIAAGHDSITADILCLGRDVMLTKLADLLPQCLRTSTVPKAWKNVNLVLHKKGDAKELRNHSLFSVTYKLFTKVKPHECDFRPSTTTRAGLF